MPGILTDRYAGDIKTCAYHLQAAQLGMSGEDLVRLVRMLGSQISNLANKMLPGGTDFCCTHMPVEHCYNCSAEASSI